MKLFKKAADITKYLLELKENAQTTGFVPTMGALHQGHISLLHTAKENNDLSICSIFVNPTQFNDKADYDKYPTTLEEDIDKLDRAGCDILFLPSVAEIYPEGTENTVPYNLGYLETVLEGKFRPGHFQGVCQVVHRLLTIIPASQLFLGQKDYQQCMVIKKLVEEKNIDTEIIICPTLRENDGLAMSSRNMRLPDADRKTAVKIFETLSFIKNNIKPGDLIYLQKKAIKNLEAAGFKPDYIEIAKAANLELIKTWDGKTELVALTAAFLGDVRLIDNMFL